MPLVPPASMLWAKTSLKDDEKGDRTVIIPNFPLNAASTSKQGKE